MVVRFAVDSRDDCFSPQQTRRRLAPTSKCGQTSSLPSNSALFQHLSSCQACMPVIHFLFDIWDAFVEYGVPQSATRGKSDRWKRGEWTASQRGGIIAAALAGWLAVVREYHLPQRRWRIRHICAHDTVFFRSQASLIHHRCHLGYRRIHTHPAGAPSTRSQR